MLVVLAVLLVAYDRETLATGSAHLQREDVTGAEPDDEEGSNRWAH